MGMFLSMSGVMGATASEVESALTQYALKRGGTLEPDPSSDSDNSLILSEEVNGVCVVYPGTFFEWDDASAFISLQLGKPVFSFHIHDGDLWMYLLYQHGKVIDKFNPLPEYWEELEKSEVSTWKGNAALVASLIPTLDPAKIAKYLVPWGDEILSSDVRKKAYPEDEFFYGDDWQLVDFLKRLGLDYPLDDHGAATGSCYRLEI